MEHYLNLPLKEEDILKLKVKDLVYLSGIMYTARDAAHMKIKKLIEENKPLPFDLKGEIIYYTGPSPALPNHIVGSIGPTTSKRMDSFTPLLHDLGLKATIGKGERCKEVVDSIIKNKAVYFCAIGGTGALLHEKIKAIEVIAFPELGPEAIHKLDVKDFPVVVGIDSFGNNIFNY